jgi:hypothetical protein
MKKTILKVITLFLATITLVCTLTSCAKRISGSYSNSLNILGQSWEITYTFKGSKVEAVSKLTLAGSINTETAKGKYEIIENEDGTLEITFDFEEETDMFTDGTFTFEEGEDFIQIGGYTYNKK